jgi:hypothetical protein
VPGADGKPLIVNNLILLVPMQFDALTEIVPLTKPVGTETCMAFVPAPLTMLQPAGIVHV